MKIRNTWLALCAVALTSILGGCTPTDHKAGVNINNNYETAVVAAETPLFAWPKIAADGAAATTTPETALGLIGPGPQAINVATCQFHTAGSLTFNASNNAQLVVAKRTNGGSPTTIASLTTSAVSWVAFTNVGIPLAATPEFVSPGDSITVTINKNGTGVIVPQGELACFTNIN